MPDHSANRFLFIDAVRGWAILGVLTIHASAFGNNDNHPWWLSALVSQGRYGVQLFFLASAFTLFLSAKRRSIEERFPIRNFFTRRFFRIAPLYYLAIPIYIWSLGPGPRYWLGNTPGISTGNVISNFLFVHGVNPYWINSLVPGGWSITVEMSFYALCPLLFRYINNLSRALFFLGVSVLVAKYSTEYLSTSLIPEVDLWGAFLYIFFPFQLQVFALGIVLFFLIEGTSEQRVLTPLAGLFILCFLHRFAGLGYVGYFLPACVVIFMMSRWRLFPLNNPIIRTLGRYSYGLYIVHWGVLQLLEVCGLVNFVNPSSHWLGAFNFSCRMSLLISVGLLGAYLLERTVEAPGIALGKKIIRAREKSPTPESSAELDERQLRANPSSPNPN
jgi:peptidoglycan/LPS O-acetylase OafA/YrhL